MKIRKVFLKDYTSMRIGGEANLVIVTSESELLESISFAKENNLKIHILGSGTNTIFKNNLENFLIIKMEIVGKSFEQAGDKVLLTVNAGESWDDVVNDSVRQGLWGIENLSLIPGTVGAAPVQNIGAYGIELCDVLESVRVYDTQRDAFVELTNSECKFGYRDSIFKQNKNRYIIVSVVLMLSNKPKPILTYKPLDTLVNKGDLGVSEIRELVVATRQTKLPDYNLHPNAGSFFKNSVIDKSLGDRLRGVYPDMPLYEAEKGYKVPTAWLIEHVAMMKGLRVGDVGTWPNQPLVLVNYGLATYDELNDFSQKVIDIIYSETGILLEREVNVVG